VIAARQASLSTTADGEDTDCVPISERCGTPAPDIRMNRATWGPGSNRHRRRPQRLQGVALARSGAALDDLEAAGCQRVPQRRRLLAFLDAL